MIRRAKKEKKKKEKKKKEKAPKQPKEKKVKPKKEKKPKPPAEPDNTAAAKSAGDPRFCDGSIHSGTCSGRHTFTWIFKQFCRCRPAFAEGRYSDAFQAVAGEKVKEKKDTDTYEKYRITAMVSAEYEAYESMMDAEVYDMALDSLIRTV